MQRIDPAVRDHARRLVGWARRAWVAPALLLATGAFSPHAAHAQMSSEDQVRVKAYLSQDAVRPGDEVQVALELRINPGWHVNSSRPSEEGLVATRVGVEEVPAGLELGSWHYPEGEERSFAFSSKPLSVYEKKAMILAGLRAGEGLRPAQAGELAGSITVQACNDRLCLRPGEASFSLEIPVRERGAEVAAVRPELFEGGAVGLTTAEPGEENRFASLVQERGYVLAFASIFFFGILLCLTPCVLPMIPITAGFFSNQAEGSRRKAFLLAFVYIQGLALVYGVLGTVAGLTGDMLGGLLQHVWVQLGVAAILVVLSLSMFGLYEFKLPGLGAAAQGRAGYVGALLMGAFLGVVAAPCIGPFSVALLAYVGQRGDAAFGFLAFLVLAEGLGLPFLLLAVFTELAVPKAGEWTVWVKKVFGVLILGLALFFLRPLLPEVVEKWAFLLFTLGGAVYLAFLERTGMHLPRFRAVKAATGLVIILGGVAFFGFFYGFGGESPLDWRPFSIESLEASQRENRPAMVDFYADWCVPCKELEHVTFSDDRVAETLEEFHLYKADVTTRSKKTVAWRQRFRFQGVPTVLFFDEAGRERLRLQEVIGPEELLRRMERAGLLEGAAPVSAEMEAEARERAE